MKRTIKLAILALVLVISLPQVSEAYLSTKQTSIRLSDNVLLFLITYEFGHEDLAYKMPVVAKRGSFDDVVGYDILKDGRLRTSVGESVSIVLSDAKLEAGKYVVLQGEAKEFTLISFLTLPEDRLASSTDYSLKVSSLPFEIGSDNGYLPNKLNESELRTYQTPVINTNKKIGITTRLK